MFLAVPQRPPCLRDVSLGPPAVQLREVDASIDENFHAARPASLPGPAWRIEPDIHALYQVLGQMHVIVTEEDHMGAGLWPPDEMHPFLYQGLSRLVGR